MAIKCLSQFTGKLFDRQAVLDKADALDITDMEAGISARVMHAMGNKCFSKSTAKQIEILHANINCKKLVPLIHKEMHATGKQKKALQTRINSYWNSIGAEYCDGEQAEIYETDLTCHMSDLMSKQKVIFINICLMGYFVDLEEEDNYSEHGTSAILIPVDNTYRLYYVNSHGNDLIDIETYETIGKTKRSLKELKFDTPVDVLIMMSMANHMKTEWSNKVMFEDNTEHVYYGVNMQAGDGIGSCYIFPWVIYYNLGKYYDKKRTIKVCGKRVVLDTASSLIKGGKLEKAIQNMFIDFNDTYTNKYMLEEPASDSEDDEQEYMYALENIIEQAGDHFVLNMINSVVMFMEQDALKKIVCD